MQQSLFEIIYPIYKVTKPIRLIEAFGGYGSQHFALNYLGVKVEHWKLIEWAVKSIQAYKDGHYTNVEYKCDETVTKEVLIDYLHRTGISFDYNKPATREEIKRRSFEELKQIALNIKITKNLVNICNVKGKDLEIVDKDKYEYIFTYSFPCQDLSLAGKGKGMKRDSGTRSGMLWEVERILEECNQINSLPQILLMENVPQVIGTDNVNDFNEWQLKLESLGYKNYHQNLIATDYGIPQTRNRTFMVSILGDYSYTFPNPIPLKLKLKDLLEDKVDEKYYLSDKQIKDVENWNAYEKPLENMEKIEKTEKCPTITTRSGAYAAGMILIKEATKKGYAEAYEGDTINLEQPNSKTRRGRVGKGVAQTLLTQPEQVVIENNLKTKLCNDLISNGIVKENDVIKHSYTSNKLDDDRLVPNHNISPTLDTKCDCLGVVVNSNIKNINDENGTFSTLGTNCGSSTSAGGGVVKNNLRIRKLTPKECFRLQGVKDEDYERIAKNQSNASLYHLAGDSIEITCLMAIFGELLNVDWKEGWQNDRNI